MKCPGIFLRRTHRCEPDLPIKPWLIGRDERRGAVRTTGLGFEFVFFPLRIASDDTVIRSLKNDFITLPTNGSECAIGVYETEPIERGVHHLPFGNEVRHRSDAQIG